MSGAETFFSENAHNPACTQATSATTTATRRMERETKRGQVKDAAPSPGTSACYDNQIAQESRIFNCIAAWRIDDVTPFSERITSITALLFRSAAAHSPPRRAPAAPPD